MKKLILVLMVLSLLAAAAACSASEPVSVPMTTTTRAATTITAAPPVPSGYYGKEMPPVTITSIPAPTITIPPPPTTTSAPQYSSNGDIVLPADRMIIRTANLQLVVGDIADAIQKITDLAGTYGGFVVSSNSWQDNDRMMGNIAFRVKAENFDQAIAALHNLADDVRSESTSGQDVTEEYVDLSAQLTNLQAAEQQLLKLMEQAGDVSDILKVQQELVKTRGQIEQTKGRMQYLEQSSALSLVQVSLEQSKLSVEFTASTRNVKEGEKVYFNPSVSGGFGPYSYQWDFGNGETSTEASPAYAYRSSGTFSVSLKVTDDRGNTESYDRQDYITVQPGWTAGNTVSSAWRGMVVMAHGFVNFLIWLVFLIPLWIVILVILYFAWWRRRKKVS
jgi:hypothetical protein